MKIFTIAIIVLYNIIFFYNLIKKKDFLGLGTIINFGVVLNFLLYILKWSRYIDSEPYVGTYVVIDSIIIIFIIVMLLSKSPFMKKMEGEIVLKEKKYKLFGKTINLYLVINIIYILLFLLENYIGSRNLAPYLFGIDIHTYSAPLISFVTRALFVMVILNFLCYKSFNKKYYIAFMVVDICLFLILRGARINVFMAFIQFVLFYLIYNYQYIIKNKKIISIVIVSFIAVAILGVYIGNRRIDNNLKGNELRGKVTYSDYIKYSGPKDPLGLLPWYYGYFPMSYANLNLTLEHIDNNNLRTYGVFTARPILVGLFELDNMIKGYKDIEYSSSLAQHYTEAATVRTGFMEFYLDFGYFAFISIAIYAFLGLFFYNMIRKNIFFTIFYAFFGGCWFFMSFQNMMIDVTTLYGIIYIFLIYRFCVDKNKL